MKKVYLMLTFMLVTTFSFSQAWLKDLPQKKKKAKLTFYDYKNAFESYWAPFNVDKGYYKVNGINKKAIGWKQFKRWEYYMESQIDPSTGKFPQKSAQEVYEQYLINTPQLKSKSLASWTSLGTNNSTGGYAGIGRLNCIAFHPTDNNTYWVGAAAGGLWVTTNNGSTWTCLTDNNGVLAVSDIIIPTDFATSNTIYIATGDKDAWDNRSIGVLKSTNGGASWTITGISFTLLDYKMVYRLLVDPNNNQTLLAATSNGVYKTTNGGVTWSTQLTSTAFIDMEYKPGDFNTLYGSTTGGKIHVSSNGGSTWTQAYYDANARRIELAVSSNQPDWVFALAAASNNGFYGIYQSTNSGFSYTQVFAGTTKNLLGWYDGNPASDVGGQGWYDLSLAVSPSNANTLLVGGVDTWRSTDAGTNWSIVNHWYGGYGGQAVHADKHALRYRANGDLFECNDGGVYVSTNNGTSWTDKTNGMAISQMYKLSNSATSATEVITGLQDNGTKLLYSGTWHDVKGGDGMECIIDYSNVNIQYGTYVYGQISRTTNHWSSATDIEPSAAGDGAWVTPYLIDPITPTTLYAGYADVWKTTDRGTNWTKISTMNTSNKIRSMAIAPSNTQVLYVANQTVLWKTTNGGTSWTIITGTIPTSGYIMSIAVKDDDANTLWVTLGGYNANRVYQSIDGGTTWSNISTGLPSIPTYSIVQNKQSTAEVQLYVGTEVGIYYKKGSDNWISFNTGLPNVRIGEIEIYYAPVASNSKLRAATYGRGLWETTVSNSDLPMTYVSATTTQNNTASVAPSLSNQDIIGIEIVANGNLNPLSATSFTFNTTGSTNPATDITNAKLFTTGSSNVFASTTQFGSASVSPNGSFTITGTQTLNNGTNYFWLAYDVPAGATLNNVLDAQCTSLTVGTAKTPTMTNPAGNRQISIIYCSAGSPATTYEYISNFTMGSINQASGRGTGGYENYSSQITNMQIGVNTTATINVTNPYATNQIIIWIDWNKDGDFMDAGENVYTSSGSSFTTPLATTTFAAPSGTPTGSTRMRVRLHDTGAGPNTTPCGDASWGEVEDYSINVLASCIQPSAPLVGTITQPNCSLATGSVVLTGLPASGSWTLTRSPGNITTTGTGISTTINGLASSTYTYTVTDAAACTSVASANVVINTQPTSPTTPIAGNNGPVCSGTTLSLTASTISGATYLWTGPNGYTSALQNPAVSNSATPVMAGTYSVIAIAYGCSSLAGTTTVIVNPLPSITAIASPATICAGTSSLLTAGSSITPATFTWLPGSLNGTPVSASPASTTTYIVTGTVTGTGCTGTSTVMVTVNPKPVITPTATPAIIYNGSNSSLSANCSVAGTTYVWNPGAIAGTPVSVSPGSTTTYTVTGTAIGCTGTASVSVTLNSLLKTLQVKIFVDGLYIGAGMMRESNNFDLGTESFPSKWGSGIADTVTVVLYNDTYGAVVAKYPAVYLHTDGNLTIPGISSSLSNSYYITIFHRNSVPVTSATPISFAGSTINYDFTTPTNKAYGVQSQKALSGGVYGMYGGELNHDIYWGIDGSDLSILESVIVTGPFGYLPTDLNGDGAVDGSDLIIIESNLLVGPIFWNPLLAP